MVENAANSFAELSSIVVVISSNSFEKELLLSVCLKVRSKRRSKVKLFRLYSFVFCNGPKAVDSKFEKIKIECLKPTP